MMRLVKLNQTGKECLWSQLEDLSHRKVGIDASDMKI